MRNAVAVALLATLAVLLLPGESDADFAPGHYFDSTSTAIQEFTPSGAQVGAITIQGLSNPNIRGLAFGPDGYLYAVDNLGLQGYEVLALDSKGAVHQTYRGSDYIGGNISLGKIAFDATGHFYVGDGSGLSQFTVGNPNSGSLIYSSPTNGIFGIKSLPNGDLLVTTASEIYELTTSGSVVRQIGGSGQFVDLRGIAYDPGANVIFATMLGSTGDFFQLMKLNPSTGALLASTTFIYGDDITLTGDGRLLVGSRTQSPGIFDRNLNLVGQLPGGPALFVAASVPEPAPLALCASGLALAALACRRLSARRS